MEDDLPPILERLEKVLGKKSEEEVDLDGLILFDPPELDEAIVGVGCQFTYPVAIYSYEKIIKIMTKMNGGDREAALEWFSFNTQGSWLGHNTPIIAAHLKK